MTMTDFEEFQGLEGAEDEPGLISGGGPQYLSTIWFNGFKNPYADQDQREDNEKPKGYWYSLLDASPELKAAVKRLVSTGKAVLADIRHEGGTIKPYFQIKNDRILVLSHGILGPDFNKAARAFNAGDATKYIGIVAGNRIEYQPKPKKGDPYTNRYNMLIVLAVSLDLYEAGYADADGVPLLVRFQMKGPSTKEFYAVLKTHMELVERAEPLGFPAPARKYWAFWQSFNPARKPVTHEGTRGSTEVYPIESGHPLKDQWTAEYLKSHFCGAALFNIIRKMMYDLTVSPPVPGGPVVEYCADYAQYFAKNHAEYAGPNGQEIEWGSQKPPMWLVMKSAVADSTLVSDEARAALRGRGATEETTNDDEEEVRAEVQKLANGFRRKLREEDLSAEDETDANAGLEAIKAVNLVLDNRLNLPLAEVLVNARRKLREVAKFKQNIASRNTY